ncbi:MAG: TerB family tellurite resistance protein, partial [Woeseiaceae bacterium]|nr:TerB family tellurite resistance protein [Woeseiaceae bacterium]
HEFTHLLHNNLNDAEKEYVVAALWEIAHADGDLDKYEEALVLKISDALHVARPRVMRLKHDAAGES